MSLSSPPCFPDFFLFFLLKPRVFLFKCCPLTGRSLRRTVAQICGLSAGGIECREAAYMRSYVKSFLCWEHAPWALPDTAGDQKAPNAYFWLELSDHMTAVTANHSGHMTQMLASASRHLDALKGLEGGGRKGLRRFSLPVITLTKMCFVFCLHLLANKWDSGGQ